MVVQFRATILIENYTRLILFIFVSVLSKIIHEITEWILNLCCVKF